MCDQVSTTHRQIDRGRGKLCGAADRRAFEHHSSVIDRVLHRFQVLVIEMQSPAFESGSDTLVHKCI